MLNLNAKRGLNFTVGPEDDGRKFIVIESHWKMAKVGDVLQLFYQEGMGVRLGLYLEDYEVVDGVFRLNVGGYWIRVEEV